MSLLTLLGYVAIIAVLLTIAAIYFRKSTNWFLSFWQNFVGVLLLISGFVKAIDPVGTQYKMEQYFAEFETTFAGSKLSFLAPLFPVLSKYALAFGIFMIVLELVLGIMLLLGSRTKWVSWTLFFVMLFFTLLTGFTYLTGYVPNGVNFFDFAKWGLYEKTNMRVTDCGCFGDFIKLEPKVSFFKDIFLMFPSILFLFAHKSMHHWFNRKSRAFLATLSLLGFSVFCFRNFYWDLPVVDFRPFKIGTNIKEQKEKEMEAAAKVEIIGYVMYNEKTGVSERAMAPNGMDAAKFYVEAVKKYPAEAGWKVKDQIKTEPAIEHTKISDFTIYDTTENESEVTDLVIEDKNPSLMIVAYKLPHGEVKTKTQVVYDSVKIAIDTVKVGKEMKIITRDTIVEREISSVEVDWNQDYLNIWHATIMPFANAALKAGYKVNVITHDSRAVINDFEKTLNVQYNFYQADDILLKTIIRSNPGVVLMKDGKVINMWHYKQLPSFESVKIN